MNNALKTILESAEALNENGLQVLALIAGVIRQVAPSQAVESVELPETEPAVEPSPVAPSSPTYRLVLNVPEIGLKGFAD